MSCLPVCVFNDFYLFVSPVVSQGPRGFAGVRGLKGQKGDVMVMCQKGEAYLLLIHFLKHFKTQPKCSNI